MPTIITREDRELEVAITGTWQPAEPSNGIFTGYWEEVMASTKSGEEVELTKDEQVDAESELYNARQRARDEEYLSRRGV